MVNSHHLGLPVAFDMTKTTVSEGYYRYPGERAHGPRPPGSPRKLTRVMEEAFTIKATACYETHVARVYSTLADFVCDTFGFNVSNRLVHLTVKRSSSIKTVLAHPMEEDRVAWPFADIDAHFSIHDELKQMPACLVSNFDEMGWSE
jgi:hypothetical protein